MAAVRSSSQSRGRFVATLEFSRSVKGSDAITDAAMDEIVRRLRVTLDPDSLSDIVRSEGPPADTTKLWLRLSDKVVLSFITATNSWEETSVAGDICLSGILDNFLKLDDAGCLFAIPSANEENLLELDEEGNILLKKAFRTERFDVIITSNSSGNATSTVALTTFSDDKAAVNVMPLADLGADARWWVSDQTNTSITVSFAGLPVSATRNIAITASQTVIE